ncbi:hypothetical protein BGZ70_008422 [Mortierella alpina]|uniref:Uncharacterized protein n=1 Tax=Mortierella alpina TaxID=64518 RepID=A0A9P6M1L3_MORAP|nr:hypothetical protein BGZ70_008422 [Mortierella alpina]
MFTSSMFFGGLGALSREIEALHHGVLAEQSKTCASVVPPVTVAVAAETTLGARVTAHEGVAISRAETSGSPEAHPSVGSVMVMVPRRMNNQVSGTAAGEGPLKLYRVTIEEVSSGDWKNKDEANEEEQEEGVELAIPTVSTTTKKRTTTTTTTTTQSVMLPAGMVETLLRGIAGGAATVSASAGPVRVEGQVESTGSQSQQHQIQDQHRPTQEELPQQQQQRQEQQHQQQHEDCGRQGTVEPMTQFLNPAEAAASSEATHATVTDAATDTTAGMRSAPMRGSHDNSSVPVLVSKVKELSPSVSWSSPTASGGDPNPRVAASGGDKPVQVVTQKSNVGLNHSQKTEEGPERDLKPWWQRRRDAQSAPHHRSHEDQSLRRGKGSNSSDGDDDGDGDGLSADRIRRRSWPPRRYALRNGETVTQSTVIGPDGTVKSRTVIVTTTTKAKQDTEKRPVETSVRSGDIQQHQPRESAPHQELLQDSTSSQHLPTAELQPQEQQHRSKLRERWARRHHRQQAYEDLWNQKEGSDEKDERHFLWERRRQQRERLRELREAEAQQREATAAAYGFNVHHQTLNNNTSGNSSHGGGEENAGLRPVSKDLHRHDQYHPEHRPRRSWRVRDQNGGVATVAVTEGDEEGRVAGGRTSEPRRTWPPKGYLRRQELERDEPRHNV